MRGDVHREQLFRQRDGERLHAKVRAFPPAHKPDRSAGAHQPAGEHPQENMLVQAGSSLVLRWQAGLA